MRIENLVLMQNNQNRKDESQEFGKWLLEIGEDTVFPLPDTNIISLSSNMIQNTLSDLTKSIYDGFQRKYCGKNYLKQICVLSTTSKRVYELNTNTLNEILSGETRIQKHRLCHQRNT